MGSPLPTTMGSMACGRRCLVCFSLLLLASTVVDSGGIPPLMYNRPLRESLYPSLSSRDEKRSDLPTFQSKSMSRFGKRFDNMPDIGDVEDPDILDEFYSSPNYNRRREELLELLKKIRGMQKRNF